MTATTKTATVQGIAPRRNMKTYVHYGRETYADTGRPVDECHGTHVVLWIVDDAEAWAAKIEADGDARVAAHPKDRIAKQRRFQAYENAADVRARGAHQSWRGPYYNLQDAQSAAAELYRSHPNPGVRYEVAEITEVSACETCHQPTIYADGQWRHASGGYAAACRPRPKPVVEEPRQDGEFEIGTGGSLDGYMVCGYCDQTERWAEVFLASATMTGDYMLGVEVATGDLVVLAEATTRAGQVMMLPHHCEKIPDEVREKYADGIAAILEETATEAT
jgi:hypothetical protein